MSDGQSARRRVQGAPGGRCRWGLLWIWAWLAARLALYFGYAATLAQPPMPQQPVCPRKVLSNTDETVKVKKTRVEVEDLSELETTTGHERHMRCRAWPNWLMMSEFY